MADGQSSSALEGSFLNAHKEGGTDFISFFLYSLIYLCLKCFQMSCLRQI